MYQIAHQVYKRTFKHSKRLHAATYKLTQKWVLPCVEACLGFRTPVEDPLSLRFELVLGSYESETTKLIKRILQPGMTVLDVGAHVGYYTQLFSKLAGASGRVIAFEPHPRTFEILRRNTSGLDNVTLVNEALLDSNGAAVLYDSQPDCGSSALQPDESKRDYYQEILLNRELAPRVLNGLPLSTYPARTRTLDSFLNDTGIASVDLVKMDIEGAEIKALQGMTQTIRSSRKLYLVIEFNPSALKAFGIEAEQAFYDLRKHGFTSIRVIGERGGLVEIGERAGMEKLAAQLSSAYARVNLLCEKVV